MKICIIGTGYVGLVTAACFAETGNTVYAIDIDENKIELLKLGQIPIYEPGLQELVKTHIQTGHLIFSTDLNLGINNADVAFIAVGTPQDTDGSADLSYVKTVCEQICKVAKKPVWIATKSTVPVGTGEEIEKIFTKNGLMDFVVFSNPEFLKEGDAINDFMKPDRIVIGTNDDKIIPLMRQLYAPFSHLQNKINFMSRRSAEITKYAANAMLAVRISFMNEIAKFCDVTGANINDVRRALGADPRIGSQFLYAGLGYGGSCFPKDVRALLHAGEIFNSGFELLRACDTVNQQQVPWFFAKIQQKCSNLNNIKLTMWGLTFKSKTDDLRESQALKLLDLLLAAGAKVCVCDPKALEEAKIIYGTKISYNKNAIEALHDSEGLIIATDWNEYKSPDFSVIKSKMRRPVIFDGRNLYDARLVIQFGFEYVGVGQGTA